MKLIHTKEFDIIGRGKVFVIPLKENNLPVHSPEFAPLLKGKEVEIDGVNYVIWGIELYGIAEDYARSFEYRQVSVLVKPVHK